MRENTFIVGLNAPSIQGKEMESLYGVPQNQNPYHVQKVLVRQACQDVLIIAILTAKLIGTLVVIIILFPGVRILLAAVSRKAKFVEVSALVLCAVMVWDVT